MKTSLLSRKFKTGLTLIFSMACIFVAFSMTITTGSAQILKPVKWTFGTENISDKEATLVFTASIDKKWHLYSQFIAEGGPIPTSFKIKPSKDFELIGKTTESGKVEELFDPNFDMKLVFFSNKAVFRQKIKIKNQTDFKVSGSLEFMTCDDHQCLPPTEIEYEIAVSPMRSETSVETPVTNPNEKASLSTELVDTVSPKTSLSSPTDQKKPEIKESTDDSDDTSKLSLWTIFIKGFLGGLVALLTPCVFPMIPLTVSFFTKKAASHSKAFGSAVIYGVSIIGIYVILGFIVTKLLGADALNDLASNGIFNMGFFILLIVFAASFFGAFEIQLPYSWTNAVFLRSEKGGLLGIFFMAFTLALVSFSCTGPIIGTLLVDAAVGGRALNPLIGMFGFSLALAVPFALFAAFPNWLHALPKSGGWLNSVKIVLGFLELAFAFKFLSNVDLAYHFGILDREVFLSLWIIIFGLLGLYLLGKISFPHDSEVKHISVPRFFLALISLSFAIYMVPGLWGAPLKAISAFSPPQGTQDFDLSKMKISDKAIGEGESIRKKYSNEKSHCALDLNCFFDVEQGMEYARKHNKPVLLDFTGWTCVNCRKMEVSVWSDPGVYKRLSSDYIVISLYVDDKTELPLLEQKISAFSGNRIKTIGNLWSDFEASKFGKNSQPYYVLLDHNGEKLVKPRAFDLNIPDFTAFLDSGKAVFKRRAPLKQE
jgi:thiol:disulfide interchange protein